MARVGLIFGGRTVEHQVSLTSAKAVAAALREAGHEVVPFGVAEDGCWLAPEEAAPALCGQVDRLPAVGQPVAATLVHLIDSKTEILFPIVHGTWGEDGSLQGLCEMLDLPYVGAGVAASAVAMDKVLCKRVLTSAGLPVVEYAAITAAEFETAPEMARHLLPDWQPPLFIKPSRGGSSVGISRVLDRHDLPDAVRFALTFDRQVLVERGVDGRELECSVLGHSVPEASAIGEIVPGNDFYDYEDKYLQEEAELTYPADLPEEIADELRRLAVAAYRTIGASGMARVDFLLEDGGTPWINEINTLPGFTQISMYPKLWDVLGLGMPELMDRLLAAAFERHEEGRALDAGIRRWLDELEGE
ncbi:MAG: D-alanine--D-alanine ligase family protein [Thermoanaerobaculia bacterium]